MMPQLTGAFGVNALGVSAIVDMFYYGCSLFSLVAGASMDRFGAKRGHAQHRVSRKNSVPFHITSKRDSLLGPEVGPRVDVVSKPEAPT
jgi:hypothetical protein